MSTVAIHFATPNAIFNRKRPLQALARKILTLIADPAVGKNWLLDVSFIDAEAMQTLNDQYRQKNYPTNILSFAESLPLPQGKKYLGSLVLCLPVIQEEALAQGKRIEAHVTHLLVHGCLHLLGYNHEQAQEAKIMEDLEIAILKKLNISNPYE